MVALHALGAVRATADRVELPLGGPRQRRLLAVLLVHHGEVVSVDRVAEAVFAGAPTAAAGTTLRSYVARLRRVLAATGSSASVATRAPGYQLRVRPDDFDVTAFEASVTAAAAALDAGEPEQAVAAVREGLDLWQGRPYAEFEDEDWAYAESQRLLELRLTAHEVLVDAELALGHGNAVAPLLESLCTQQPLREAFRAQLMTAYYASGRQADALAAFRSFRQELAEELGIDPSPALVDLERRILRQDPELHLPGQRGSSLRGYQLGERLGTGSDGTVQAARLPGVDQVFALKRLRPDIADDPDFVRWFEPSARALASLRHDGVLPLHDYWREPGAAYLVTPRMPGGTLRDRIRRRSIDRRDVARVVERVGGGLEAADGAGLRHGRICAEKVLYDAHGDPVLGDFWLGQPDRSEADDRRDFIALIRECLATVPDAPAAASERLEAPLDERTGIADLVRELTEVLDGRARAAPRRANPYQGLRAFDEGDAAFYFGREALVRELCERLDGNDLVHRLVLLVGASGTGKSSVVRAGLLPQLRAGAITASGEWFVTVMVPGAAPLRRLAEALRTIAVRPVASWPGGTAWPVDQLARELRDEVGGLDRTLRLLVPSGGELLLVVDQLEELFTLSAEPDRRLFLDALVHALTAPGSRLRVVATLRADYYDRPLAYQAFGSMVDAATVAMPVMLPVEIEAAVVEPAKRAGRSIDRELVTELVGRLSAEPVALPALQFVLFALAERSGVGPLRMRDYHALGGLDGAIAARAEELYRSRDDEREQVRDMFERLVVVDREGEPTRRRVVRTELSAGSDIVDAWTKARLLTLDVHPQHRVPTVEVAHEALVREWPRLRDWLEQDRAELIVLGRLREAAAAWDELGREPSALYRGTSLEAALDVGRRRSLIERERDFLTASVRARAAERRSTDEMIARQARTNRRLRFQLAGIALALVGALAGGLLAVDQRGAAVRQRHLAVARELAAAADANLRDDPERSILLALAAVDATARHHEGVLPEATEALHRGVVSSRVVFSVPDAGGVVDWSSDGRYFTTEGVEESGMVDLYDARTGARVRSWRGDAVDLNDVSFSGDGRLLATSGDDGAVKVWSIPSGHLVARHGSSQRTPVWGPSLNRDGSLVAASWFWPGRVVVSDTRTGRVVHRLAVRMPEDTAFSPDGRFLAVVSERSEVVVFDLRTGRRVHSFRDAMEGIRDIAWSPDGRWLTAAASDGAYLFEGATGRFRFTTSGQISAVNGVAWSRDSGLLATGSNDGTAVVHRVDEHGAHELLSLSGQDLRNGVRSVAFSPDGTRLLTGDWAITAAKVWDIRSTGAAEIANVAAGGPQPGPASLAPDGRGLYVTTDGRHLVRQWFGAGRRSDSLQPVPARRVGHIAKVVTSPDGARLAAATDRGRVVVWETRDGRIVRALGRGWHADWVEDLAWSPDSRLLAVSTTSHLRGTVRVVDGTGRTVGRVTERPGLWMPSVDLAGGRLLLTDRRSPRDDPALQQTRLWDWRTGRLVRQFDSHALEVALAPTGALVATARLLEGIGDVWDRRTGAHLATLEGHTGLIDDITFNADGTRVATSSSDGTARIWEARTGTLLTVLRGPSRTGMASVQFSQDGTRLLTAGDDGIVRVWTLDTDELIGIARSRLSRGLTTAECRRYLHQVPCPASVRGPAGS